MYLSKMEGEGRVQWGREGVEGGGRLQWGRVQCGKEGMEGREGCGGGGRGTV